jgi:hypothetical protein
MDNVLSIFLLFVLIFRSILWHLFKFAVYAVVSFEDGTGCIQGTIVGIYHRLR